MQLFIEILLLAVLVYALRTIRANRFASEIERVAKIRAERKATAESEAWMRAHTHDTRPDRERYVHEAPNYTTYTEQTGKFKIDQTGKFKV